MDLTLAAVIVAVVAVMAGSAIQGAVGFGMNLVTVPALALVSPEAVPVTVILLGIPISLSMLGHEHTAVDRSGVGWITAGRLPGSVLGALVVASVSSSALQGLVGVLVLLLVLASVVSRPLPVRHDTQLAAGLVSGVTGTAAGIGGPPLALLYQHRPGSTMRSTLAASFLIGTFVSLGTLALAGQVGLAQFVYGLALAPLVVLGSVAGRRMHGWLDRGWLRPAVLVFAALAALTVLLDALA